MITYRVIQLKNGWYKLQSFETSWFINPFRKWENCWSYSNSDLDQIIAQYNFSITERDKRMGNVFHKVIKQEDK